jgi:hypothetical protein
MTESGAFFSIERSESSVDLLVASRRSVNVSHSCLIETPPGAEMPAKAASVSRLRVSKGSPITWSKDGPTGCDREVR